MTILNKAKKTVPKSERHSGTQQRVSTEDRKPDRVVHSPENRKGSAAHSSGSKCVSTDDPENCGRNSEDEYDASFRDDRLETAFEERLRRIRGFTIKKVGGDGACLFRAVADQVYGDEDMHLDVRRLCLDYMEKNRDHFSQFITEDFAGYIARKRRPDAEGNHIEVQAISEIYLRPVEIYEYSTEPKNIFNPHMEPSSSAEPNAPLRLSYHGASHYNSVVDPQRATVGVGLGLPGFAPGSADRNLIRDVLRTSEMQAIEEAMLKDKMKMSDFERTEQEISEQVARESYMEYLRSLEKKQCNTSKGLSGVKRTSQDDPSSLHSPKLRAREDGSSVAPIKEDTDVPQASSSSGSTKQKKDLEVSEWAHAAASDADERALLAHVLAISHQEYLDSLKKRSGTTPEHDQAGSSKRD